MAKIGVLKIDLISKTIEPNKMSAQFPGKSEKWKKIRISRFSNKTLKALMRVCVTVLCVLHIWHI